MASAIRGANAQQPSTATRIIPEMPGQMMFVSESVAKARVAQLQEYTAVRVMLVLTG